MRMCRAKCNRCVWRLVLRLISSFGEQAMTLKSVMTATKESEVTFGLSAPVLGNNEQAKEIFGFLQAKTFTKDREGFILGDVFADGVVRNGGFTEFAEKVNGRVAQIAFPLGLGETFNGDLLDQLAAHPIQVSFTVAPIFEHWPLPRALRPAILLFFTLPHAIRDVMTSGQVCSKISR